MRLLVLYFLFFLLRVGMFIFIFYTTPRKTGLKNFKFLLTKLKKRGAHNLENFIDNELV